MSEDGAASNESVLALRERIQQTDAGILLALRKLNRLDQIITLLAAAGRLTERQAEILISQVDAAAAALDRVDPVHTPEEVYDALV